MQSTYTHSRSEERPEGITHTHFPYQESGYHSQLEPHSYQNHIWAMLITQQKVWEPTQMDSTDGTVPNSHYKSSFLGRRITPRHALPEWLTRCLSAQIPLTAVEWSLASNYTNIHCRLLHSTDTYSGTCTL